MSVEGFIRLNQDTQAAITDAALVSLLPWYQGLELAYESFIGLFHKKTNTEGWGYDIFEEITGGVFRVNQKQRAISRVAKKKSCGISRGLDFRSWNFCGVLYQRFVEFLRGEVLVCLEFLGVARVKKLKIPGGFSKKYVPEVFLTPFPFGFFWNSPIFKSKLTLCLAR